MRACVSASEYEDKLYARVLETSVCVIVYIMFSWSNKPLDTKKKHGGLFVPLKVGQILDE